MTIIGNICKKQVYFDDILILHKHCTNPPNTVDDLFKSNHKYWQEDLANFERRKKQKFGMTSLQYEIDEKSIENKIVGE